ncbi:MAG: glycosyltransferase family 2 protein [Magnetococcales bacterium]|nr:glycosyltransferase family 2 protein [Magnetococcales bacterium]
MAGGLAVTRKPLSVVIITKNAGKVLHPCLQSATFADEVVLVDCGSDDDTLEIARQYQARIIHQPWLGFGPQKRFAVEQARHDWVLCLDSDERISTELQTRIVETLTAPKYKSYLLARRNRFLGRWLSHGEGYPDWVLRLFHRDHATWSLDPVHEKVETNEPVGRLRGDLYHESEQTLADYVTKQNTYTSLQAELIHRSGRRFSPWRMFLNPLSRFIKFYFFRLGLLDGLPGLIHIALGSFASFLKYAKVLSFQYDCDKRKDSV